MDTKTKNDLTYLLRLCLHDRLKYTTLQDISETTGVDLTILSRFNSGVRAGLRWTTINDLARGLAFLDWLVERHNRRISLRNSRRDKLRIVPR